MEILQLYSSASSQCINLEKSSVCFSSNMGARQRKWIKNKLGVKEVDRFESYLGLPTLIGRSKYKTFSFLKDRVWKKLQGWKGKLLSKTRKEVLIKVVAQSIPTYTIGMFQLPKKLCNELNAMYARFWWGQVGNERKIHWQNWESLSKPKKEGGWDLGTSGALEHGWRLMHAKDSLFYECFKAKYFPRCSFLEAVESPNCSFVWRSIMAAQEILTQGCCWRVGIGSPIRVTKDKRIPNHPTNMVIHPPQEDEWE